MPRAKKKLLQPGAATRAAITLDPIEIPVEVAGRLVGRLILDPSATLDALNAWFRDNFIASYGEIRDDDRARIEESCLKAAALAVVAHNHTFLVAAAMANAYSGSKLVKAALTRLAAALICSSSALTGFRKGLVGPLSIAPPSAKRKTIQSVQGLTTRYRRVGAPSIFSCGARSEKPEGPR